MNQTIYLFDGAQIPKQGALRDFLNQGLANHPEWDLYAGEPSELHGLGPVLCIPEEVQKPTLQDFFRKDPNGTPNYVSILTLSPRTSVTALVAQWRAHALYIDCDDRTRYYLRFADMRVFASLRHIMNAEQWHALTGLVLSWTYRDRANKTLTIDPARRIDPGEYKGLIWNADQYAKLLDAAWPDALLEEVQAVKPDWWAKKSRAEKYDQVQKVHQQAAAEQRADDLAWQIRTCLSAT